MRPRQFVPFALVSSLLVTALIPPLWVLTALILALYFLADSVASVALAKEHGWHYLPALFIAHPTMHIAYGLGFLVGLVRFANRWGDKTDRVPTL
jgi:hypothetical protein